MVKLVIYLKYIKHKCITFFRLLKASDPKIILSPVVLHFLIREGNLHFKQKVLITQKSNLCGKTGVFTGYFIKNTYHFMVYEKDSSYIYLILGY